MSYFKELWNWSEFLDCYIGLVHDKPSVLKLYVNHILAFLTNMGDLKLRSLNSDISEEILLEFEHEQSALISSKEFNTNIFKQYMSTDASSRTLTVNVNSSLVTNIEGVILPIFNKDNYEFYSKTDGVHDKIVRVDSTKVNLRSIALGTTAGKAICLSGPVGCGKTTLVEYLARKTGRICPKQQEIESENLNMELTKENNQQKGNQNVQKVGVKRKHELELMKDVNESLQTVPKNGFVRVQLGDQTDCKTLLGQYHCTDVPGEFIWLPGVLTQVCIPCTVYIW